jgi:hypothetical protein
MKREINLARTLKMADTLPSTIRGFQRDLAVQQKAVEQIEQSYETRLNCSKIRVREDVDKRFKSFNGRPWLAFAQLSALILHLFDQSDQLIAALTVVLSLFLFAACFKPLWWWLFWSFDRARPQFPIAELEERLRAIRAFQEELRKHELGLHGEELVARHLEKNLPDSYNVINDVTIHYRGKKVQIDHLVVGPTGLFAVETKNITGNYYPDAQGWLRLPSHTIRGVPVRNYRRMVIPCPQEQSMVQAVVLSDYLCTRGINPKVNNAVVITNPQCRWNGGPKDSRAPVMNLPGLAKHILSLKHWYNDQALREIIAVLLKCGQKNHNLRR